MFERCLLRLICASNSGTPQWSILGWPLSIIDYAIRLAVHSCSPALITLRIMNVMASRTADSKHGNTLGYSPCVPDFTGPENLTLSAAGSLRGSCGSGALHCQSLCQYPNCAVYVHEYNADHHVRVRWMWLLSDTLRYGGGFPSYVLFSRSQ